MTEIADLTNLKVIDIAGRICRLTAETARMNIVVRVVLDQEKLMRSAERRVDRRGMASRPVHESDDEGEAEDDESENFKKRAKDDPDVVIVDKERYNACMEDGKSMKYRYQLEFDVSELEFLASNINYLFAQNPPEPGTDPVRKPKIPADRLHVVGYRREKLSMPTSKYMMGQLMRINSAARKSNRRVAADKGSAFKGAIVDPWDYSKIQSVDLRARASRIFWNAFRIHSYYRIYMLLSQYKQLTYSDNRAYNIDKSLVTQEGFNAFFFSIYQQPPLMDEEFCSHDVRKLIAPEVLLASQLWRHFYRQCMYTCDFIWRVPVGLFGMSEASIDKAIEFLRTQHLLSLKDPPTRRRADDDDEDDPSKEPDTEAQFGTYVPQCIYDDGLAIVRLLRGVAADHIYLIAGDALDANEHSVEVYNKGGVDFPSPTERMVISPTRPGAEYWRKTLGCTVQSIDQNRHATPEAMQKFPLKIAIIDCAHQMSMQTMRNVLEALMLGRASPDDIPLIYICGHPTRKRIDERWGVCFFFDELLSSQIGLQTINSLPLVTREMLENSKLQMVPVNAAGELNLRMKLVENVKEARKRIDALLEENGDFPVLYATFRGAGIANDIPMAYSLRSGGHVVDFTGAQHQLIHLSIHNEGKIESVQMPNMYEGLVTYKFVEESRSIVRNAAVDPVRPMTAALACAQNFVPADNVVLVVNGPFISRSDLNAALALARSRLFILALPEFWEKTSIYEGAPHDNLAAYLYNEMQAYPELDPVLEKYNAQKQAEPANHSAQDDDSSESDDSDSDSDDKDDDDDASASSSEERRAARSKRAEETRPQEPKAKRLRKHHVTPNIDDDVLDDDDDDDDDEADERPAEEAPVEDVPPPPADDDDDDEIEEDERPPVAEKAPQRRRVVLDDDDD